MGRPLHAVTEGSVLNQPDHSTQDHARELGTVTAMSTTTSPPRTTRLAERRAYVQLAVMLGVAVVALVAAWLVQRGGSTPAVPPANGKPNAVSVAQLERLAKATDHPIYWAGEKSGTYELTRTADGRVYVRYLPSQDKVGDRTPQYLTVGTYPTKTAFLAIRRAAKRKGAISLKLDRGGLLVFNTAAPKSVYFGYPNQKYQVEVYAPSPQEARALVLSGGVTPIPTK